MAVFIYLFLMALHIVSLNVYGLRDMDKRAGVLQWLRCLPFLPDIVCLPLKPPYSSFNLIGKHRKIH